MYLNTSNFYSEITVICVRWYVYNKIVHEGRVNTHLYIDFFQNLSKYLIERIYILVVEMEDLQFFFSVDLINSGNPTLPKKNS